jgi:DNA polymerase III subunit delta'
MEFENILGQEKIKDSLMNLFKKDRIPHSLLFIGPEVSGALPIALALAKKILCKGSLKVDNFQHPDLHFFFPNNCTSAYFLDEWRNFLKRMPYGRLIDWLDYIGVENKQGSIGGEDVREIIKISTLKSSEANSKIIILWITERLHISAKLLKILEEPPVLTFFFLIGKNEKEILLTIRSRTQIIRMTPLELHHIQYFLQKKYSISVQLSEFISMMSEVNLNSALEIMLHLDEFEKYFITWIRNAFLAKKNTRSLKNLIQWGEELHKWNREKQKKFLNYCLRIFRKALLTNYKVNNFNPILSNDFNWENLSNYGENLLKISEILNEAITHIEKNVSEKLVFFDLSIKIIRSF